MFRTAPAAAAALVSLALVGCKSASPGPLAGTWRSDGALGLKTTFRTGELESRGVIAPVSYDVDGDSVLVIYKHGVLKGSGFRLVLVDAATARAGDITYRKV